MGVWRQADLLSSVGRLISDKDKGLDMPHRDKCAVPRQTPFRYTGTTGIPYLASAGRRAGCSSTSASVIVHCRSVLHTRRRRIPRHGLWHCLAAKGASARKAASGRSA